ncbi:MAG TPA: SRPBCC family protein [Candidatus Dormibacteraeota bacterium]|jgi:uncharacterized protein YndB with AHSA1/START domain
MGFVREVTVVVEAPPDAVFDYVSEVVRHGEWAGDKLTVTATGAGTYHSVVDMGMKVPAEISVETSERPRRFGYVCDDSLSGKYRWTFALEPTGSGTRLTHQVERLRGPLLVRLIQPWVMWPLLGRPSTARGLNNIKKHLEAAPEEGAAAKRVPSAQPPT